jgi:hypothetical protein
LRTFHAKKVAATYKRVGMNNAYLGPRQSSVAVTFFYDSLWGKAVRPKCESYPGTATWRSETKAMQSSSTSLIY